MAKIWPTMAARHLATSYETKFYHGETLGAGGPNRDAVTSNGYNNSSGPREIFITIVRDPFSQETTKDPEDLVEGSRSYQSLVTPLFRGTKAPKALVLPCFGAIRSRGADDP